MRKHSRWSHLIIFFIFCLLTMFLPGCTNAPNPPIQIRFNTGDYYTFEGWGTSLAWWAEAVGGWPDAKRAALENTLFNPGTGLGLNIIRYNFGAGTPTNKTCGGFRPFGSIPTYEPIPSKNFVLDPNQDKAQLAVLKDAKGIIMPSEAIFEGFANSAPSWMLENGCTKGNGAGNNLKAPVVDPVTQVTSVDPITQVTYEQDYANYLATIIKQFHDNTAFGQTTFRTVAPFNEPDLPWNDKGMGSQEGMHVNLDQQERVIQDLYAALKANGALSYTSISAPDDNNIVDTICSYKNSSGCTYDKDENGKVEEPYNAVIQNHIYQLNTHSYNGNDDDRVGFSSLIHRPERQGKPAWMSEYTTNGTDNLGPKCSISADHAMLGALQLSCQITRDLSFMRPTAWVYWQAVDSGGFGLLQTSDGNLATESFDTTKQYYALWQYSHFIRPGDQIIEGGFNSDSLAAMDPMSHKLVIVTTNTQSTNEEVTYDLSNFSSTPGSVTAYTTTEETSSTHPPTGSSLTLHGKQFSTTLPGGSITTFVIPTTSTLTPTNTQLPQATPSPATSLRGVDWTKVLTSTELGCNGPSAPNLGTQVDVKQFADVTGDNNAEAFVAVACVGSTESWPDRLEVFDGASDPAHPRHIATLLNYQDGTDGTNGYGLRIQSITISGKRVTIVSHGWTPGECFACGDQRVTDTFTWNGSSFTRGSRSVTQIT
jgi:O-glycosyl hydrolase